MITRRFVSLLLLASVALLEGCGSKPLMAPLPLSASRAAARDLAPGSETPGGDASAVPAPGASGAADPAAFDLAAGDLPVFTRTARGVQGDPVNLMVAGEEAQLVRRLVDAGWMPADPITVFNVARMLRSLVFRSAYPTAPISPLYLYDHLQRYGFQKNAVGVISRDHLRVWQTPLHDRLGRPFWAIGASKDVSIKRQPGSPLPTHRIDPDLDAERKLVVDDLAARGPLARRYQLRTLPENFKGQNGGGDVFFTDGRVEVLELAPEATAALAVAP
jgi:hypothetical protein